MFLDDLREGAERVVDRLRVGKDLGDVRVKPHEGDVRDDGHPVRNLNLRGVCAKVNLALAELPRFRDLPGEDRG